MSRNQPIDTLRLSNAERDALIASLDRHAKQAGSSENNRRHERVAFLPRPVAVNFMHPGGVETRCLVTPRNISVSGISFLHGGYLHTGSDCTVNLPTLFGDTRTVRGVIRSCRYITGNVHEIGVEFETEIDPYDFLEPGDAPQSADAVAIDPMTLHGAILVIENSPADARLITHHLSKADVKLDIFDSFEDAESTIASGAHDVIMLNDESLGTNGGADIAQAVRMQGFDGPMIAMTAESKSTWLASVRQCGFADVLVKPYDPGKLYACLAQQLPNAEDRGSTSGKIHSTLPHDPTVVELLESYLKEVEEAIKGISACLRAGDKTAVRAACLGLKGTGRGYGYPRLSDAAREVVDAIDENAGTSAVETALKRLELVSQRLAAQPSGAPQPAADPRADAKDEAGNDADG